MSLSINIKKYSPTYKELFLKAKQTLTSLLPTAQLHHIGSTAIEGCDAKPIIDILAIVSDITTVHAIQGYEALGEFGISHRRFFRKKGQTHLHVFEDSDPEAARHLRFVAYMNQHPERIQEYSQLKRHLAQTSKTMSEYINGKASFVKTIDCAAIDIMGLWPSHPTERKKNWSSFEIKEAMSVNATAFFSYFAPYSPLLFTPFDKEASIISSCLKHDEFNNVFRAQLSHPIELRIKEIADQFDLTYPFSWWVFDLDSPSNLAEKLIEGGATKESEINGMYMMLESTTSLQTDREIRRVFEPRELKVIYEMHAPNSKDVFDPLLEQLSPHLLEEGAPMEAYLLFEEGEPVTTLVTFYHANCVGIYYVGTSPNHRKKGFASQMMRYILARAKQKGYNLATLQSSKEAESLYHNLGFKPLGRYRELLFKEPCSFKSVVA